MTIFMRLINQEDKFDGLLDAARAIRSGSSTPYTYEVDAGDFSKIPRSPFAYWISKRIRGLFVEIESFELEDRTARAGLQTSDDFRFLRLKWEVLSGKGRGDWRALA